MPTVPRITERTVADRPLPSVQIQPAAPLEAFGGGQAAGQAVETARGLLHTVGEIAIKERQRADDVAVQDAYSRFVPQTNSLLYDEKAGALSRRGKDAMGVLDSHAPMYDKAAQEIEEGLANQTQRDMFKQIASKRKGEFLEAIQRHTFKERLSLEEGTFNGLVQNLQEDAAVNSNLKGKIADNMRQMEGAAKNFAANRGISKEETDAMLAKIRSGTHASVLRRMLVEGQVDEAEKYEKVVSKEILDDDLRVLDLVKSKADHARAEAADEGSRELYMRAVNGQLPLAEVDNLFALGRIDRSFFKELRSRVLSPNDDPAIAPDQKTEKFLALLDEFKNLRGSELDKNGKLIKPATKNDLKTLTAFRSKVAQSSGFLTEEQERAFYNYTQRNFNEARSPKVGIFDGLLAALKSMPLSPEKLNAAVTGAVLRIFDSGTSVSQASAASAEIAQSAAIATNPNRSLYQIGQILNMSNGSVKVVGFDTDGEPLVERLK